MAVSVRWPFVAALLFLLLLSGCISFPTRYATFDCSCRADREPVHLISLKAPTGNWAISGHSGFLYGEVASLSIRLPERPVAAARYEAGQIVLTDESPFPSAVVPVTGGDVQVDPQRRKVTVSLQTAAGAFWANGVYSLR
ncbi:hypothetical protein ASD05_19600 [Variovorax sp. Root434]|nr:hypothetical protein ASD05_19600 [Variovorax sp. Root434]